MVSVEKPRLRERVAAGAGRTERQSPAGVLPQPAQQRIRDVAHDPPTAADDNRIQLIEQLLAAGAVVDIDGDPVTRDDRLTVQGDRLPSVHFGLRDSVRHAQRLDG